jgi:hypothetical protein
MRTDNFVMEAEIVRCEPVQSISYINAKNSLLSFTTARNLSGGRNPAVTVIMRNAEYAIRLRFN